MTFFFLAVFANLWVWRVLRLNFLVGIAMLLASLVLAKRLERPGRRCLIFLFLAGILLIFLQIQTTQKASLTAISNDDRRVIDMRLRAYPLEFLRVGYWLEERRESLIFNRVVNNLFENLDLNLYFFANHPQERVAVKEFEKFPYILLPVFLIGIMILLSKRKLWFWSISFFLPLVILSFIGNKDNLGPFSLFPFFIVAISEGLKRIKLNWLLIVIFLLVLIQTVAYEIY